MSARALPLRYAQDWKPTRQSYGDATDRCQQQPMGRLLSAVDIDGVSICDMSLKVMLIFSDISEVYGFDECRLFCHILTMTFGVFTQATSSDYGIISPHCWRVPQRSTR